MIIFFMSIWKENKNEIQLINKRKLIYRNTFNSKQTNNEQFFKSKLIENNRQISGIKEIDENTHFELKIG